MKLLIHNKTKILNKNIGLSKHKYFINITKIIILFYRTD